MPLRARTVLVTGASRGLGLEFVKQILKLPTAPEVLVAACRDPTTAKNLQVIAQSYPAVKIVKLDVEKDEDIDSAFRVCVCVFYILVFMCKSKEIQLCIKVV